MNVLVTGATGYLGRRVCSKLIELGFRVTALARTSSNVSVLGAQSNSIRWIRIDDRAWEKDLTRSGSRIDSVVHMATCYGRNSESAMKVYDSNLCFPLKVFEVSSHAGAEVFFNVSSSLPPDVNLYALSKWQFSEAGKVLAAMSGSNFINLIVELMYGGSIDEHGGIISQVCRQCLEGSESIDLTSGEQSRDFVHVDDVADVIAYCVKNSAYFQNKGSLDVEIGTGNSKRMRDVLESIKLKTNSDTILNFGKIPYRENEDMEMTADIALLREIGYPVEEMKDIEAGLNELVYRFTSDLLY